MGASVSRPWGEHSEHKLMTFVKISDDCCADDFRVGPHKNLDLSDARGKRCVVLGGTANSVTVWTSEGKSFRVKNLETLSSCDPIDIEPALRDVIAAERPKRSCAGVLYRIADNYEPTTKIDDEEDSANTKMTRAVHRRMIGKVGVCLDETEEAKQLLVITPDLFCIALVSMKCIVRLPWDEKHVSEPLTLQAYKITCDIAGVKQRFGPLKKNKSRKRQREGTAEEEEEPVPKMVRDLVSVERRMRSIEATQKAILNLLIAKK